MQNLNCSETFQLQAGIQLLQSVQHITALHWDVDAPPGARLEIRSRTGNALQETYVFYDKNGKEVTQKRYDKLIPSFRGAIDTLRTPGADWSTWSRPYDTSGQLFLSPAPRRYVQLELRFVSEKPLASAALNELRIEYNQPLAQTTRAEIFPPRSEPGQTGNFTYYYRCCWLGYIYDGNAGLHANNGIFSTVV